MYRTIGRRVARTALLVGSIIAPLACGGGGGGDNPTGTTKTILVTASPTSLSLQQGATGTVTVNLIRGGGFTGNVNVAITGLPSGITTSISPSPITSGTTTATVTVTVASTVAPGAYTATVTASGTGVADASAPYGITVTAAPNYTLTLTPNALSLAQGASGTAAVAIARTGFTGAVNLALSGAPAGVTGTFNPAAPTADASSLTVNVASTVAPGTYNLTVTGTATGVADKTAALTLTVTAAAGYSLALTPATVNLAPGSTATSTVAVTRSNNFTGAVTLAVESPPAGITASFNPSSVTGTQSTMTVNVAASVAPGSYTLTVKGTATGVADQTTQLTVVVAAATFSLTAAPNAVTVQQGTSGTSTITIGRTNFTGNVTLSLDSPPAGVTGTFAPGTTAGTTSTFTVNVGGNVTPGNYILTVRGTASGIADKTVQITVTVTAAPGSINISLSPAAITVQQGLSGQTTLNVARTNFTSDVSFAASGAPGGITVTFSPTSTTASATTVNVAVSQGQGTGTYPVTITATGTGIASATTTLNVTVSSPVSGGNSIWQFCDPTTTPVFFAYQDGTGNWQRVLGAVNGTTTSFSFSLTQNRGGVMFVTPQAAAMMVNDATRVATRSRLRQARAALALSRIKPQAGQSGMRRSISRFTTSSVYDTQVFYGTATELTTLGTDNCNATQPTKLINGTVTGVSAGQFAQLSLGGAGASVVGTGQAKAVQFSGVPFGAVDLIGTRSTLGSPVDRVILQRNLNIPDGGALPATIDFASAQAFAPASATATISNSLGDQLSLSSLFFTANGEAGILASEFQATTNVSRTWSGIPSNQLANGDLHGLLLGASPDFSNLTTERLVFQFTTSVANQSIALGPNLDIPTATVLAVGSYPRYRFQGSLPQEYRSAVSISISFGNTYSITATSGYLSVAGSASVFDLPMPDVAALNGFPVASRLTSGVNDVMVEASGWNGGGLLSVRPNAGDVLKAGIRLVTISVP